VIPPRPLRRLIAPVWVALGALAALAAPLLEAAGRLASRLSDRPHPLAVTRLLVAYLVREAAVIVACAALWVASGFGARLATEPFQARHYALLRWFVAGVVAQARATLGLRIDLAPDPAAAAALADAERPLIVFSRHAGPGDSVLLVDMLLARFGRRPCVVMKEAVALDPVVDLVAQRLPTALLGDDDDASCASVAALARQLDGREALLLFPEGGNFSPERRLRAIRSLRRRGSHVRAARAERLAHTLAPPGRGGARGRRRLQRAHGPRARGARARAAARPAHRLHAPGPPLARARRRAPARPRRAGRLARRLVAADRRLGRGDGRGVTLLTHPPARAGATLSR
jgi:1-acyl-sn-glycerol-3-phosphate acyltransferase